MRSLSVRLPSPPGSRWSEEMADLFIGQLATIGCFPFGPLTGEVVAAHVLDDEMGHALWVTVLSSDQEGEDVAALNSGLRSDFSVAPWASS